MSVKVNGKLATSALPDTLVGAPSISLLRTEPTSASPILPQLIKLFLSDGYDATSMESDVWTVQLKPTDGSLTRPNGSLARSLNVVAFNQTERSITVKYGGAYSGFYDWTVSSQ